MVTVTPDMVETFQRDGVVLVKGLWKDWVPRIAAGIERNMADPGPYGAENLKPGEAGRFFDDYCNWERIPEFRDVIYHSDVAQVAASLMQSPRVQMFHDHVLVKEPGTRQKTPWHQDQPYYNIDGMQNISMWIPVDPVSRAATLEFVAGSHKGPWLMPRTFMDHQAKWFPEGSLADLPDVEATRAAQPILGWAIEPGDVVCFHMLTLHAAGGVEGPGRRRVFSLRFLGDDTTHAPRAWPTSPDFPGLADQLPAGAPMKHPLFPLLLD
jgi:ectoine hydroxylase-related dioxygenase (phytanoyl-CoA dioxygenase family)